MSGSNPRKPVAEAAVTGVLPRWLSTLKFKIMLMAAVVGVLSAVGTVQLVLPETQRNIQNLLLEGAGQDRENAAALFSSKLQTLQTVLTSVARDAKPVQFADAQQMQTYLERLPALNALFTSVFAATPDGTMLARLEKGRPARELPNIADREYFQRVMRTDQPVVSQPVLSKVSNAPVLIIAVPVLAADGRVVGTIAGALSLQSSALFSELTAGVRDAGTTDLIIDREGTLLAHSDADRVMGRAADEPGLQAIINDWRQSGSPIDTEGRGLRSSGFLVSIAGIPLSDWILVRKTPESAALAPVAAARRAAWIAAGGVAVLAIVLSGAAGWFMTRPIAMLRARAERLLVEADDDGQSPWPNGTGEIGDLARAFEHVVTQRSRRQSEVQALLAQLEAVLDHAEVGIALTRDGRFELVSRHFCHVFRCDKQDAVGQPTRMIYASDEAFAALVERARPSFLEHGAFDGELRLMRRNGQEFWAHMRGRAVVAGDVSQGTIWTIEDVTAAREQRDRLTYTATHDALTGLANRAAFEVVLDEATRSSGSTPFCALFIDLDRFKQVNDVGGHAAGDAMLRDVAHQIASVLRKSDVVARLGGDEFAVLLPNCPEQQANELAEKIRSTVISYRLTWEGRSFGVGASIGLIRVCGHHASVADVLRAADAACYAAKRLGRNRVEIHRAPPALAMSTEP